MSSSDTGSSVSTETSSFSGHNFRNGCLRDYRRRMRRSRPGTSFIAIIFRAQRAPRWFLTFLMPIVLGRDALKQKLALRSEQTNVFPKDPSERDLRSGGVSERRCRRRGSPRGSSLARAYPPQEADPGQNHRDQSEGRNLRSLRSQDSDSSGVVRIIVLSGCVNNAEVHRTSHVLKDTRIDFRAVPRALARAAADERAYVPYLRAEDGVIGAREQNQIRINRFVCDRRRIRRLGRRCFPISRRALCKK